MARNFGTRGATIDVDGRQVRASIDRLIKHLNGSREVFEVVGRVLRDYTRETIELGGRSRPFAPLSWWTKKRTGRTKPLLTLRRYITYRANKDGAQVYFDAPSDEWDLNMHHYGYTIPARRGHPLMVVPFKNGRAKFFRFAKAAKVPARKVWPTVKESEALVSKVVSDWLKAGAKSGWRP